MTVEDGLNRGEGMQCEDLRTDEEGNLVPETCRSCGGLVFAVNETGYDVEHLQLIGGPGVVIDPDADNHRIYVRLEEEGICSLPEDVPIGVGEYPSPPGSGVRTGD